MDEVLQFFIIVIGFLGLLAITMLASPNEMVGCRELAVIGFAHEAPYYYDGVEVKSTYNLPIGTNDGDVFIKADTYIDWFAPLTDHTDYIPDSVGDDELAETCGGLDDIIYIDEIAAQNAPD